MSRPRVQQRRRVRRHHQERARERWRENAYRRVLGLAVLALSVRGAIDRQRRRERAEAALPRGPVSCGSVGRYSCFCAGKRYTFPRCLRFVPLCFGAADDLGAVCDDCYAQLIDTPDARAWSEVRP